METKRLIDDRPDLLLVDACDEIINMSDGSQQIMQHQAYIAKIQEDGTIVPYNPTTEELVLLFLTEI